MGELMKRFIGGREGEAEKIAWWNLWKRVYLDHELMKFSRKFPERGYSLYTNQRAILSGLEHITVVYSVDGFGMYLDNDFKSKLRGVISAPTKISFVSTSVPTSINWSSPEMVSRIRNYRRLDQEISEKEVGVFDLRENYADLDKNQWLKESVKYLSADGKRSLQLFDYYTYIVVTGIRGDKFDKQLEKLEMKCASLGLIVNRVVRHMGDFLKNLSPMSLGMSDKTLKSIGKQVLSDEIISRTVAFDQGKIGAKGVYMGTDIYGGFPVFKQFKKSDVHPENVVILAETGWGKSFTAKTVVFQLLAQDRCRGSLMDFEGNEYLPLASFFANKEEVLFINMGEGQGSYFDPVEVITTGNESFDKENNTLGLSKSYTQAFLKTLVGEEFLNSNQWAGVILDDAISLTYFNAGVMEEDYHSWGNSAGLSLHTVYNTLKAKHEELRNNRSSDFLRHNEDYLKAYDFVRSKLSRYFETAENGGILSGVFCDKVNMTDVARAKLVVCSFGMRGRSLNTVDNTQLTLSQLSAAIITHLRTLFCFLDGKFNVKVWEELQRWASFPGAEEILNTAVTGGRKLGDINILVSNDPTMFLGIDAKLKIFSNITSFMIGAITDAGAREKIANALSVPELLPELNTLVSHSGNLQTYNDSAEESSSEYYRAFLTRLDKSVTTLVKFHLPDDVARSELFRTGSEEKKVVEEIVSSPVWELDTLLEENTGVTGLLTGDDEVDDFDWGL